MFYIIGLKASQDSLGSRYIVHNQILISSVKGFDEDSKNQMDLGFVVQGPRSQASVLAERETIEAAVEFVESEYSVYPMPTRHNLTRDSKKNADENISEDVNANLNGNLNGNDSGPDPDDYLSDKVLRRYGVRELSVGTLATFDFSPTEFGGKPYEPTFHQKGCEVVCITDKKGTMISQYLKAAILGSGGSVEAPTEKDIKAGLSALENIGFVLENHKNISWNIEATIGKEPQLA